MVTIELIGGDRVIARMEALPPRLMGGIKDEVRRLTLKLLRHVKEDKLSGQTLKNQTGTLRRKINQEVLSDQTGVVGKVGVKLSYARAHEFGFDGMVTVHEHLRQVKQAFGRVLSAPVTATVHPFERNMRLPERSFLRSALHDMEDEIATGIDTAVRKAVERS